MRTTIALPPGTAMSSLPSRAVQPFSWLRQAEVMLAPRHSKLHLLLSQPMVAPPRCALASWLTDYRRRHP